MTEGHDIQLKVMLTPEEYLALRAMADDLGVSQSGLARMLIKRALRDHIARPQTAVSTDEKGPD